MLPKIATPTVSIHPPKTLKPQTREEFGYFLAGLIDSDGHISKPGYVQIDFNVNEINVAYYIKSMIGYGKVTQEEKRFSVRYRCTPIQGLSIISDLIRDKLKHLDKINQFNTRLVPKLCLETTLKLNCNPTVYKDNNLLENHWLAGFIQGDGSLLIFQCKVPGKTCLKTTLSLNISQKTGHLLKLIKVEVGGHVGYRKKQNTYYYLSNSFTNAAKFIHYLDKFQLMGNKLTQYWVWREAYLICQNKHHLTHEGEIKIALKKEKLFQMRRNETDTLSKEARDYRLQAKLERKAKRQVRLIIDSN
uniref:Putative site-specific DNA endonuclease n=1 Tax=Tupiella akineta TaxID=160070 RepID=Q3ZIZ9_TUPAK|nr:putative site-specific DNA endonuclease [Tupiella akineta]AAV80690.1 putative site-specific DNA endonuclease [Tupiella akineta]